MHVFVFHRQDKASYEYTDGGYGYATSARLVSRIFGV